MPMIEEPEDRGPLLGGGTQIMIGGPPVHQIPEWERRKAESSTSEHQD
jgi:hypothetical protein